MEWDELHVWRRGWEEKVRDLIPTIRRVGEVTMTATISHRGMLELIRLGFVEAPRPRRGQQRRHRRKHPVLRRRRAGHIVVSDRRRAG